ncbi:MAG: TRAP transporter small permease [Planctomycetota bacterium]|jgi:C4-dicarboxylate transporter DctQ subunit|nr:TRAP transporter small permease [Planctomycetota bacterium]
MNDNSLQENGFNRLCARCSRALGWIGGGIILLLTVTICIQVFYRYILNDPQAWSEMLAQFAFIWLTLLGAAMAVRTNDNLTVTFIYNRFTGIAGNVLQIALDAVVILVSFFWLWSSVLQIRSTWSTIEAGINIRLGAVYLVFPAAFALIMLFSVEDIMNQFRRAKQNRGGPRA